MVCGTARHPYNWSGLTKLQLGRYAEYFVKMEFTLHGCDVYGAEVDDKGIDFVIRTKLGRYYEIQAKSVRDHGLICLPLRVFEPRENLLVAVVNFADGSPPDPYLIPSGDWETAPSRLLVRYTLPGKFDEYQLRMKGHLELLRKYSFADVVNRILS
jgi:hypothetical protein